MIQGVMLEDLGGKRRLKKNSLTPRRNIMICFSWSGVDPIYLISETRTKEIYKSIFEEIMLTFASKEMPLCLVF